MRKKYSEEYKTSAIKMVLEKGKTPTEVAQNLGIPVGLLYKWIRKHKGIDSKGKTNDFQEENKRLKDENQELKKKLATSEMYREILKKAAAYFAAETL
jgi:transposase